MGREDRTLLLSSTDYRSKAKNPRSKSMYRNVAYRIPYWDKFAEQNRIKWECVALSSWLNSYTHFDEVVNRWHTLVVDESSYPIMETAHTTHITSIFRVHDKYNLNHVLQRNLHNLREIIFL